MKRLLLILILLFSFQSLIKADDIKDFEIDDMSIGDSLLIYFSKSEIKERKKIFYPGSDEFYGLSFLSKNSKYDYYGFILKKNDKKFKIYQIKGSIKLEYENCLIKKDSVFKEIKDILLNPDINNYTSTYAKQYGKSFSTVTDLNIKNGSIRIWCENFDKSFEKTKNWENSFNVDASSEEYLNWLDTEAYSES